MLEYVKTYLKIEVFFIVIDRVSKFGECVKYNNYLPYKALKNRRAWYNLELCRDKFFESNERSEYS